MVQKQQELYTEQEILSNMRAADGTETTGVIHGTGDTEQQESCRWYRNNRSYTRNRRY